jgi:AmmeMemoRadiSam system protein B/AmmeMemoRadiSam system protein A
MKQGILVLLVLSGVLFCTAPKEVKMERKPAVAGQFYPDDEEMLKKMLDSMIARAEPPLLQDKIIGILVPHAGVEYSGSTAAYAYKLIAGMERSTVVMLGPSHRAGFEKAAVYAQGAWRTPLGKVAIDEEMAAALIKEDSYFANLPAVHAQEHSLEVQLPFLQRVLQDFKIVPIMLLFPSYEECERVGRAIARVIKDKPGLPSAGRRYLLLASSDLYHGYSYNEARQSDSFTLGLLTDFEPRSFYQAVSKSYAQEKPLACGGYPIVALMVAARELGANKVVVLHHTNSNDVIGQRGGYCVGYSAVAFVQEGNEGQDQKEESDKLTRSERKSLLDIARGTIEQYVRTGRAPDFSASTEHLKEKRGVFVTLHKRGELRGCIGYVEPVKPLYLAVRDMAISAATEDPRFPPVTVDELSEIDIEITVLSPLRRVSDPESVIVGRHGLLIRKGFHSGLLLPQVPVEQGWTKKEFLEFTCRKAGLMPDAYKDSDAELYVFEGEVFGEKGY